MAAEEQRLEWPILEQENLGPVPALPIIFSPQVLGGKGKTENVMIKELVDSSEHGVEKPLSNAAWAYNGLNMLSKVKRRSACIMKLISHSL